MKRNHPIIIILILCLTTNCKKDDPAAPECPLVTDEPGTRFFEFQHASSGDTYIAWTSDTAVINDVLAQLQRPEPQRLMHINGVIDRLPESCRFLNPPWSWYFVPGEWQLADLSIELCDGNPRYVEENLDEYVNVVGRYCPWGSWVKREIIAP